MDIRSILAKSQSCPGVLHRAFRQSEAMTSMLTSQEIRTETLRYHLNARHKTQAAVLLALGYCYEPAMNPLVSAMCQVRMIQANLAGFLGVCFGRRFRFLLGCRLLFLGRGLGLLLFGLLLLLFFWCWLVLLLLLLLHSHAPSS